MLFIIDMSGVSKLSSFILKPFFVIQATKIRKKSIPLYTYMENSVVSWGFIGCGEATEKRAARLFRWSRVRGLLLS